MKYLFPMLSIGPHGGNRVLIELMNSLIEHGHSVEILTSRRSIGSIYPINNLVKISYVGGKSKFSYLIVLLSIFFKFDYDSIIANHFSTYLPCLFSRVFFRKKMYYFVQDLEFNFYSGFFYFISKLISFVSYKDKKIISANDYLSARLESYGFLPCLKVNVGVSEVFFNTPIGNKYRTYDIVHFARSQQHKRLDLFLEIINKAKMFKPDLKILIVSNDVSAIDFLNSLGFEVNKPKNDLELIELIDSGKLYLLCSDHEGFSLPPLECMARGKPLALFPCGGPSVYTNDSNSILLNRDNIEDSARCINELLCDINRYEMMSANAILTAKKFKLKKAVNIIVDVISIEK